jgi:hypothetical protein
MRLQIVLAMTLVCGMVSVGCSDSETSGSGNGGGGLDCNSSYSVPTSLEQLTLSAIVAEGNGKLCDVPGVITALVFGPAESPTELRHNQFEITTLPPPQTCKGDEIFYYTYSYDGALGVLAFFEVVDEKQGDYVAAMNFCQTSSVGGDYVFDLYDEARSWQRGTFEVN